MKVLAYLTYFVAPFVGGMQLAQGNYWAVGACGFGTLVALVMTIKDVVKR